MLRSLVNHFMGERPMWAPSDSEKLSEWEFIKLVDQKKKFSKFELKKRVTICSRCESELPVDAIPSRHPMDCPNCGLRFRKFRNGGADFCNDVYAWEP
jgi:hypothetical protein